MFKDQLIAFPFFALFALASATFILKLKKPEHILLSASIISAPWSGGFWLSPVKFDFRLTFFFLIAAFVMSMSKPQRFKNKIPSIITVPLFALIGWSLISAAQAYDTAIALGDGPITMLFNFLFLITITKIVQNETDLNVVIKSAFLGLFLTSLLALVQYKTRMYQIGFIDAGPRSFMWWRPRSTFQHANAYGMYQMIILPIVFRQAILMFKTKNKKLGRNYIILFCISAFTLFITQNRGSWVGLAIGMFITVGIDFFRRRSKKTRKIVVRILIVLILLFIFSMARYGPRIYDRLFTGKDAVEEKAKTRASYNVDAWNQVKANPIFGVGVSNIRYYSSVIFTHNLYLLMLSETGYPGLTFFLLYMLGHLIVAKRALNSKSIYVSAMGAGFLTTMLGLLIASYPGPDYGITSLVSTQLWIVSGIIVSLQGIEQRALKQQKLIKKQQILQNQHYQEKVNQTEMISKTRL